MIHFDPTAALKAAIAEEIRDVRRLIEAIAEIVVSDEAFAMAHIEQLQALDLAVQRANESADMLERMAKGACPRAAIESVRLTEVQDRMRAAIGDR